jgi:acetylornithine deacetylase
MGRVLTRLEALDRELQSREPHPLVGPPSLHASLIDGGRELSSYPDLCRLQMERRTVPGEAPDAPEREVAAILEALRAEDPEFEAGSRQTFMRPPYELAPDHELPRALSAAASTCGCRSVVVGMSFWTDAAVLASAGIPSVLFGPGGAGLHSVEEYVVVADVLACRNTLARIALEWC